MLIKSVVIDLNKPRDFLFRFFSIIHLKCPHIEPPSQAGIFLIIFKTRLSLVT